MADEYIKRNGTAYNDKHFYHLTQLVELKAIIRRVHPTYQNSTPEITSENNLGRNFTAEKADEKWLTDVTEMKYGNGEKLYLSAIFDLKGRDIVSFAIGKNNNCQLVFDTFDMAVQAHPDAKPLFHSDRGLQHTRKQLRAKLDAAGMTQSMSRVGRCVDNGPMEGFWGILKCEMYYLKRFQSYDALAAAIEDFILFYNHRRRQRRLDRLAPADYRRMFQAAA